MTQYSCDTISVRADPIRRIFLPTIIYIQKQKQKNPNLFLLGDFLKWIAVSTECMVGTWSHEIEVQVQIPNDYSHLKKYTCTPNGHFDTLFILGSVATISDVRTLRCCLFSKGPRVSSLLVLNMLPSLFFFFFLSFSTHIIYVILAFWVKRSPSTLNWWSFLLAEAAECRWPSFLHWVRCMFLEHLGALSTVPSCVPWAESGQTGPCPCEARGPLGEPGIQPGIVVPLSKGSKGKEQDLMEISVKVREGFPEEAMSTLRPEEWVAFREKVSGGWRQDGEAWKHHVASVGDRASCLLFWCRWLCPLRHLP